MKRAVIGDGIRIEYTLIQATRRDLLLQALPQGETRVYAPKTMRLKDIDAEVRKNARRIEEMHRSLDRRMDEERRAHPVTAGSAVTVEGEPRRLLLRPAMGAKPRAELADGGLLLYTDKTDEDGIRADLRAALAERALSRIRERLTFYGPKVGGSFGRVTIREQRSRWGSCSSKHNLNFNWKLILAPPQVLDYVVIHELCHLHEFNHSPRFWSLVAKYMPEYESWKKWLKLHGSELNI